MAWLELTDVKCDGTPGCSFLKPKSSGKLNDNLIILYSKLVDLGMEYRNGQVCLSDLEEIDFAESHESLKPG